MRPLIGIPLTLDERGRWRAEREYLYLDTAYADAVQAAGGTPVHLPIQSDCAGLLDTLDGLLLPGGDDFLPPRPYPAGVSFRPAAERQLEFDRQLLAGALERDLPVLGICYGMQLLGLLAGGSLLYHIAHDRPQASAHDLPAAQRHPIQVVSGSQLEGILGSDPEPVNSLHHQGLAEVGKPLRVTVRAEDDLIEAVEHPDRRFCIGVQWHPEKMNGPHPEALFGAFIRATREPARAAPRTRS